MIQYISKKSAAENVSGLITLPRLGSFPSRGVVLCVPAKGAYTMLNHMRELQKGLIPTPDHAKELAKIEQIFNELTPKLECGGARLRCLLMLRRNSGRKQPKNTSPSGLLWAGRSDKNNVMPTMQSVEQYYQRADPYTSSLMGRIS